MIPRFAPKLLGAAAALLVTVSMVAAQTTPPAGPLMTPPTATSPAGTAAGTVTPPTARNRGERRQGRAAMAACRTDMQTLCGTVERGKGNKLKCLIDNRSKASTECQAAITATDQVRTERAARRAARAASGKGGGKMAACRDDQRTLCADVKKGGGRKIACLKANEAKLSPACSSVIKALPNKG
jgi:hypothetical protein